jgi:hypothetical protein
LRIKRSAPAATQETPKRSGPPVLLPVKGKVVGAGSVLEVVGAAVVGTVLPCSLTVVVVLCVGGVVVTTTVVPATWVVLVGG